MVEHAAGCRLQGEEIHNGYGPQGACGGEVWECEPDCPVGQLDKQAEETNGGGGAVSRFFYCPKPSKREREAGVPGGRENQHLTVKPWRLNRYLARLLLPPPAVGRRRILVPFSGVASEMIGCVMAGWDEVVGVEMDERWVEIGQRRLDYWGRQPEQLGLIAPTGGEERG